MKYVLSPTVGLRSWQLVPHACYVQGNPYPQQLGREVFELLSRCDGATELDASAQLDRLAAAGVVHPAAEGEVWSAWSRPRSYDNRVFHSLNWAITGACNFNCRHCFMAADNAPMMGSFSWNECLALLDECERCGVQSITLTGGEPLLHPRFMDIARECARRGLSLSEINTNGSLVTAAMFDEFTELGISPEIKVSYDGVGHHDWLRGVPHAEEKALEAMRLAKEKGFKVRAQTNVHHGNLDVMFDTVELLDKMGVEEVRIIRTTETPRWRENGGNATLGIVEYYDAMLDLMDRCIQADLAIAVDVWQFVYYRPAKGTYGYHPAQISCSRYRDSTPACKGARGEIAVAYTGEVYPCNQLSGTCAALGMSFGNVKETPLHDLLTSGAYYDTVMLPVSEIRRHNAACQDCQYWKTCAGGCRAIATAFTKDYRHFDPAKCAFFKGGYMAKTDALFERAARPYRCLCDVEGMDKTGEPEAMAQVVARLGTYA